MVRSHPFVTYFLSDFNTKGMININGKGFSAFLKISYLFFFYSIQAIYCILINHLKKITCLLNEYDDVLTVTETGISSPFYSGRILLVEDLLHTTHLSVIFHPPF